MKPDRRKTAAFLLAFFVMLSSLSCALATAPLIIGPRTDVPINRQISRNTAKTLDFQPEAARARTDTLVIGVPDLFGERNPFWVSTYGDNYVVSLMYDELLFANNDGEIGDGVAHCTQSADGKTFTFTLSEGLAYPDGAPVTAADFVNTLYLLLTPGYDGVYDISPAGILGVDAYLSGEADSISGITLTDDKSFSVALQAGNPNSLFFFAVPALRVSVFGDMRRPQALQAAEFDAFYAESLKSARAANAASAAYGQYLFQAHEAGEKTILSKNETYWRGAPYVGTVEILYVPVGQEVDAILDGTVDIISTLGSVDAVDAIVDFERGFVNLYTWEGDITGYLVMDLQSPLFADESVRQALAMAFDRQAAKQNKIERYGKVPGVLLFDSFSPTIAHMFEEQFPFDQERAAALLDEAGWLLAEDGIRYKDGDAFSFTLLYNVPNPVMDAVFIQMVQDYQALGIEIDAAQVSYEELLARVEAGEFQMAFQARRLPASPLLGAGLFAGDSHLNASGHNSEMLTRLQAMADAESDPSRQTVLYELYYQQLYMEMPFIPLYRRSELLLANARVMNLTITTGHDITADAYRFFLVDTLEGQW